MNISRNAEQALQLSLVPGLGLKTFHRLLEYYGSLESLYSAPSSSLDCLRLKPALLAALEALLSKKGCHSNSYMKRVERWLESAPDRHVLCLEDSQYPELLREIYQPPPLLYLEGSLDALSLKSLAIVGSRKPSFHGVKHAQCFAAELCNSGYTVVSGLAMGIDAAAHRGALAVRGHTLAVVATGLDKVYPRQHEALAQEIRQQGVIVSEMKLGTSPVPANFPRRNRIISGLSTGVLVIEAGIKSGSLITAKYALEQNRDVYAVPGSITSEASKGCHLLIKQGAALTECVDDVLSDVYGESITGQCDTPEYASSQGLTENERRILDFLSGDTLSHDDLCLAATLTSAELTQVLLRLELERMIETVPGGYRRL